MLILLGALAGFGAALTLPGIAGLVLTIGIAVDANVLIFERIREELRTGKEVWAGYHKRLSARICNNFRCYLTTFFTALVLYHFGTGPIKGVRDNARHRYPREYVHCDCRHTRDIWFNYWEPRCGKTEHLTTVKP